LMNKNIINLSKHDKEESIKNFVNKEFVPLNNKSLNNKSLSNESLSNELLSNELLSNELFNNSLFIMNMNKDDKEESIKNFVNKSLNNKSLSNESLSNELLSNELLSNELFIMNMNKDDKEESNTKNFVNKSLSNESLSNESLSNELLSNELLSNELLSNELFIMNMNKDDKEESNTKNFVNKSLSNESLSNELFIMNMNKDDKEESNTKNFVNKEFVSLNNESLNNKSLVINKLKNKIGSMFVGKDIKNLKTLNINIITWADVDKNTYMCWGDYWVKRKLTEHFSKYFNAVNVEHNKADISLYLFGSPFKPGVVNAPYNPMTFNIAWLYSHPEKFDKMEASKYDVVMCLSEQYIDSVKKIHSNVINKPIISCSDFVIPDIDYGTDDSLVMVANARGAMHHYGREVIKYLLDINGKIKFDIKVWGHKWDIKEKYDKFPQEWFVAKYYDYNKLNILYRKSKAVLIDGHGSMEELGFVPMKLFDVFASGGLPIIGYNSGIEKMFGKYVLQYKNANELKQCIEIANDRDKSLEIINLGNEFVKNNTYFHRANEIIEIVKDNIVKFVGDENLLINNTFSVKPNKREILWLDD